MNKKKRITLASIAKATLTFLLPVFSTLFLVGTTTIIIIIMKGYSIDITKREIIKTGVLNVETNPTDVEINVDGKYEGRTNKAIPNLKIGNYRVELKKDGYFPYTRTVTIEHGLATPLIVPLIRSKLSTSVTENKNVLFTYANEIGYYLLNAVPQPTPTPTVKNSKQAKEPTTSYTLTHIGTTKPLFDDPQSTNDEVMTLQTLTATPISTFSVSPTGKQCLVTTTDKSGILSIALIPFKKGSTVNLNLSTNAILSTYLQEKTTSIRWSDSPDYILIETTKQLISYNVRTGSRTILLEKTDPQSKSAVIWSTNKTGIVLIHLLTGSQSPNYEITEVSYGGNPSSVTFPTILFENKPKAIWDLSIQGVTLFAISTEKGSYLVGKLYQEKTGDYDVTLASESLADQTIEQLKDDYSLIKFSNETVSQKPELLPLKYSVVFLENSNKNIVMLTYNKRTADTQSKLGRVILKKEDVALNNISAFGADSYILYLAGNALKTIDIFGINSYSLENNVVSYEYGQNATALLSLTTSTAVQFRVLR